MALDSPSTLVQHIDLIRQKHSRCQDWVDAHNQCASQGRESSKKKSKRIRYDSELEKELDEQLVDDIVTSDEENSSDAIASVKRRKRKKHAPKRAAKESYEPSAEVNFICEWRNCDYFNSNDFPEYSDHVANHLTEMPIVKKSDKNSVSSAYACQWEYCIFETSNTSEVKRHIYFHIYHSKLKAQAIELQNQWNFPDCKLEGDRNAIPDFPSAFGCEWTECNQTFDNFMEYLRHAHIHTMEVSFDEKNGKCGWKGCKSNFAERYRLKLHLRKHTGEKYVACPTCGAMFSSNTKYMDHCTRKDPSREDKNRCHYCWRYFSNERLLRDHMRYHINEYSCSFCDMTCSTPSVLANHVRYRHLNERLFECSTCKFKCKTMDDYNSHASKHDQEYRFQCEIDTCEFSCRSLYSLKKHFRSAHTGQEKSMYCCHLCDERFVRGSVLSKHLQKFHQLERPSGHSRFRYMADAEGYYKLQLERFEDIENDGEQQTKVKIDQNDKSSISLKEVLTNEAGVKNFVILKNDKLEDTEGEKGSPRKNNKSTGALIEIQELDVDGNIINTSLINEEQFEIELV